METDPPSATCLECGAVLGRDATYRHLIEARHLRYALPPNALGVREPRCRQCGNASLAQLQYVMCARGADIRCWGCWNSPGNAPARRPRDFVTKAGLDEGVFPLESHGVLEAREKVEAAGIETVRSDLAKELSDMATRELEDAAAGIRAWQLSEAAGYLCQLPLNYRGKMRQLRTISGLPFAARYFRELQGARDAEVTVTKTQVSCANQRQQNIVNASRDRPQSYAALWGEVVDLLGELRDLQQVASSAEFLGSQTLLLVRLNTLFGPRVDAFFTALPDALGDVRGMDEAAVSLRSREQNLVFHVSFIGLQDGLMRAQTDLDSIPKHFFDPSGSADKHSLKAGVAVSIRKCAADGLRAQREDTLRRVEAAQFGQFREPLGPRAESVAFAELDARDQQELAQIVLGVSDYPDNLRPAEGQAVAARLRAEESLSLDEKEVRREAHFYALAQGKLYLTEEQLKAVWLIFQSKATVLSGLSGTGKSVVAAVSSQLLHQRLGHTCLWACGSSVSADRAVLQLRLLGIDAVRAKALQVDLQSASENVNAASPFSAEFLVERRLKSGAYLDSKRLGSRENALVGEFLERRSRLIREGCGPMATRQRAGKQAEYEFTETRNTQNAESARALLSQLLLEETLAHPFCVVALEDLALPWLKEAAFDTVVLASPGDALEVDQMAAAVRGRRRIVVLDDPACGVPYLPSFLRGARADRPLAARLKEQSYPAVALGEEFGRHPQLLRFVRENGFPETRNNGMQSEWALQKNAVPHRIATLAKGNALLWLNCSGPEAEVDGPRLDFTNHGEVSAVEEAVLQTLREYEVDQTEAAVITFYPAQRRLIRERLSTHPETRCVDVLLPAEAQGRLWKMTFSSLVSSNQAGNVREAAGLEAVYRAVSRASHMAFVVGSAQTHSSDLWWRLFLESLAGRQAVLQWDSGAE